MEFPRISANLEYWLRRRDTEIGSTYEQIERLNDQSHPRPLVGGGADGHSSI